jgi:hypothetical protein
MARRRAAPNSLPSSARAGEFEAEDHVLDHRQMREDRIALEHDAPVGPGLARQRLAIEQDFAARRLLHRQQQPEECGLAAARRPDQTQNSPDGISRLTRSSTTLARIFHPQIADRYLAHVVAGSARGNSAG